MLEIPNELSSELGIPEEIIIKVYKLYFAFIKEKIESLPLKDNLSEEDFSKLRTNFNIPNLGKFVCDFKRYNNIKNNKHGFKNKKNPSYV